MNNFKCKLKSHGKYQIEFKTRYPAALKRKVQYYLDIYIFSPPQLHLTKEQYGTKLFLHDLQSYTRFTSPNISLSGLIDPLCDISPLYRINLALSEINMGRDLNATRILYEIRMTVNIFKSNIKGVCKLLKGLINSKAPFDQIEDRINQLLYEINTFLKYFRSFHSKFIDTNIPETLRIGLAWADEFIGISIEKEGFQLLKALNKNIKYNKPADKIKNLLDIENNYRKSTKDTSIPDPEDPISIETALYRESILKKWSQSVMYMNTEPSTAPVRIGHILAGLAAATAMSFAVAATFLTNRIFASYSVPWVLLIIVAYIFKDRIKEILKTVFTAFMPRIVSDEAVKLIDKAVNKPVGISRSLVRFCSPKRIPVSILQIRNRQFNPFRSILSTENVIHLQKNITINGKRLLTTHKRFDSITEILRIKLDSWLKEMDNPVNSTYCINNGIYSEVAGNRVYHFNIVIKQQRKGSKQEPNLFHYRLILNRKGIIRIEQVL